MARRTMVFGARRVIPRRSAHAHATVAISSFTLPSCAGPGLQSGERVFKPARTLYLAMTGLYNSRGENAQAAQSTPTFFVTSTTAGRRALLQSDRMAQLLEDVLAENRRKGRFLLHEFVIMPNHFHLLLTPAAEIPLEKALQFIKGGFSYRAKREIPFAREIWQASFVNHRIRDAEDYKYHHTYIWENPARAGLSERPELFASSSASLVMEIGRPATRAKALSLQTAAFSRV
jgi:putative transposase